MNLSNCCTRCPMKPSFHSVDYKHRKSNHLAGHRTRSYRVILFVHPPSVHVFPFHQETQKQPTSSRDHRPSVDQQLRNNRPITGDNHLHNHLTKESILGPCLTNLNVAYHSEACREIWCIPFP